MNSAEWSDSRQRNCLGYSPQEMAARLSGHRTDRHLEVLGTALAAGYFDWPREYATEEVAARLDVFQPMLGTHLPLAEKQSFELLLEQ